VILSAKWYSHGRVWSKLNNKYKNHQNLNILQAREAVEMRAQLEKKLAQKEKEKKEEHLRQLAQKAREERAGIRTQAAAGKH